MNEFDTKMSKLLLDRGMDPKQIGFFLKLYHENGEGFSVDRDTAQWALRRGFFPGRVELYGLTEENYHLFMPDYAFFLMHPYNHHFRIWVNDKLTLKYILNDRQFEDVMPEYYLYIENDGSYTYLMDTPESIRKDEDFLVNLLKWKKVLAMKPNNGAEGIGFVKFEWQDGSVVMNGKEISIQTYKDTYLKLRNYTVTEYITQHSMLKEIWPGSECTLRVSMAKVPGETPFFPQEWINIASFARVGTSTSGCVSNLDAGGIGIGFDFDSGALNDEGICYKHFQKAEESVYTRHPETNVAWGGKRLPNWDQVRESVLGICHYISSLDYLGFDIIITEDGFKICEINTFPALDYSQFLNAPALADKKRKAFFARKGYYEIDNEELYRFVAEAGGI